MEVLFDKTATQKICTDSKKAKKKLGDKPAIGLMKALNFIESASSFESIMNYGPFHYHRLQGKLSETCSLDFEGRKSKWRLYVRPVDRDGNSLLNELDAKKTEIVHILIIEVIDHG
ncbi:hypothetical protein ACFPVV_03080 [Macrococcoides bohemicum]|uniref:Plasmid maintenance system killer protein n=1 Tax=Macrococcoides bohemicum TaxID=1903056 RepID=A0A328A7V0_9STAP|nr:hypothetical protein [Macrococcus bohemicus]RAK50457.1 hypothetical protein BHX94_03035 [Macrococcus bohemicus]